MVKAKTNIPSIHKQLSEYPKRTRLLFLSPPSQLLQNPPLLPTYVLQYTHTPAYKSTPAYTSTPAYIQLQHVSYFIFFKIPAAIELTSSNCSLQLSQLIITKPNCLRPSLKLLEHTKMTLGSPHLAVHQSLFRRAIDIHQEVLHGLLILLILILQAL